jgi:hypothetical protein
LAVIRGTAILLLLHDSQSRHRIYRSRIHNRLRRLNRRRLQQEAWGEGEE